MSSILLTAPAIEPLSLAEAKAFLRVETGDDDAVIGALIAGSRIHIEAQTRRALITQGWRIAIDAWPDDGRPTVLPAPLQALTAARVYDLDNAAQALDTAAFVLDKGASALIFAPWALPAPGRVAAGIELDVTVGFGDAAIDVPEPLRQAIRLLVAHWYENRGLTAAGTMTVLPATAAALARLLVHEGGYTNHPADPGGPTNFGITIYDYRKYVKPDATAADVRAMKLNEAKAIYRSKYWNAQRCDELPAGVDYAVFDYGVNSGIGRSGKVLRRCLRLADNTSAVSEAVVAAARAADAQALIVAICDERLRFLRSLRTWNVFGRGWGARVAEVKAFSLQLAAGTAPRVAAGNAKAEQAGKGVVPLRKGARQGSAGAIAAAGVAAAAQAHQSGAGAGTVVLIVAAALAVALAAYAFWFRRQQLQQDKPA